MSTEQEQGTTTRDGVVDVTANLPPCDAVRDLISIGVCLRCILRLFGVCGRPHSSSLLSSSSSFSNPNTNGGSYCSVCLGILQFSHTQETQNKDDPLTGFTSSIADTIKRHGHAEFGSFALDISVPSLVSSNERALWSYVRLKYKSQLWVQDKFTTESISVKEALKLSITATLEALLDATSGPSSFHISLTYTQPKASEQKVQECKRRKIGTDQGEGDDLSDLLSSPLEKLSEPCSLACHCYRDPVYIGGRYLKYSRNVSQTRWIIDDERKGEASVEEIIGNALLPFCRGDDYKFHAAGREDIDVRMLGSGRPFLIEIQNARSDPSKLCIEEIENKINSSEAKLVRVKNSKVVGIEGRNLMRQGEVEKQKQYAALVWVSRPLKDEDLQNIASLKEMKISQRTPIRVLHRRSPLDRGRIIHWMKFARVAGSTHYFLLHLCTQAGTYIKEYVHGDLGRTHPSIGSILGCRAEILQLDVTDVKMNCFI